MIPVFMLFLVTCNAQGMDCQPGSGGYFTTQAACEQIRDRVKRYGLVTDAHCVRRRSDPD